MNRNATSYARRTVPSITPLWKSQNLHNSAQIIQNENSLLTFLSMFFSDSLHKRIKLTAVHSSHFLPPHMADSYR